MRGIAVLLVATVAGVRDAEFPKIPYVKRIKGPTLDDLLQQQQEFKKQNEVDSWKWQIHKPIA